MVGQIETAPSCEFKPGERIIIVSNIVTSNKDFTESVNGEQIQVNIQELFVNPTSEKPLDVGFRIEFKDSDNHTIAFFQPTANQHLYAAEAVEINQGRIWSNNSMTGEIGVYTLEFDILQGQTFETDVALELQLPPQVAIAENQTLSCTKGALLASDPECSDKSDGQTQRIEVLFANSVELAGPTKVTFQIHQLRNPYSTNNTDSFTATFRTSEGYAIAK